MEDLEKVTLIAKDVYIGNANNAKDFNTLYPDVKLKGIINCTKDIPFYIETNQLRVCIEDTPEQIREFENILPIAVEFIHTHKPVLIHCFAGMSRSCSIVAAYLMKYEMTTAGPIEAVNHILSHRPIAFNWGRNFYFADALNKFYKLNKT